MPSVSEAQHKAMEAAAHGHSTLGIPQKVGEEFVKADAADPTQAAGIMFRAEDGAVLFLKRGDGGDFAGFWCFPGGHAEPGETAEQTAIRETIEEIGHLPEGERTLLSRRVGPLPGAMPPYDLREVDFTNYLQRVEEQFTPEVSGEHTGYAWCLPSEPPEPLHPGCAAALKMLDANELDLARMMAAGDIVSPQTYKNVTLFAIRITGTGTAYRGGDIDEYAYRDPRDYLNDDFLARCNGLSVIFEHPESKRLTSDEFASRIVGSIMLPYIKGDEVWGIAKIYDDATIELIRAGEVSSTSPMVVIGDDSYFIQLDGQAKLLIEKNPSLLDHIAICARGVWDKGGEPAGIENGASNMATQEEIEAKAKADAEAKEKADAEESKLDKILSMCDSLNSRMDAMEEKAKADSESEEEKKAKADKAKADAEEKEKEETEAKAKADAESLKSRLDEMEGKIPRDLTDAEASEMADAQSKADSVFSAFGQSAPRPAHGETALAYRRRCLKAHQEHSADWKDVDLSRLDSATLGIAEKAIRADALNFANSPRSAEAGSLRAIKRRTDTGHTVIEYRGDIGAFTGMFKAPSRAMRIKTPSELRGH